MGLLKHFLPRREQIPGSIVTRVNFIVRMVMNPCDAPLVVYVETMWPAALEAAITAVDFGLADIARCVFRPWGLMKTAGGRSRRTKRPKLIRRLMRRIPLLRLVQDRKIGRNLKWLWIIDTKLQYVLLWLLIIDVVSEFLYRWTSALYCTAPCLMSQAAGAALGFTDGDVHLALSGWTPMVWKETKYERGSATISLGGARMGPGKWQICAGTTTTALSGGELQISMRIIIVGEPNPIDQDGPVFVTQTKPADLVASAYVEGDFSIIVQVRSEGGNYQTQASYLSVIAIPEGGQPLCPCT
ncbi:MAG: hypothetical protein FVQ81_18440 [Candidatus Glassbacteria bacterium]|nr:hypothetical protein [Candidatus Glassbacteria bacterium]